MSGRACHARRRQSHVTIHDQSLPDVLKWSPSRARGTMRMRAVRIADRISSGYGAARASYHTAVAASTRREAHQRDAAYAPVLLGRVIAQGHDWPCAGSRCRCGSSERDALMVSSQVRIGVRDEHGDALHVLRELDACGEPRGWLVVLRVEHGEQVLLLERGRPDDVREVLGDDDVVFDRARALAKRRVVPAVLGSRTVHRQVVVLGRLQKGPAHHPCDGHALLLLDQHERTVHHLFSDGCSRAPAD
mmetsp:Transcript_21562/g.46415  ORF Transcript_21562/g.46415 Transcript_21562/m.46415 type:complete len:247 (-) Transcript_21562:141-881(-)